MEKMADLSDEQIAAAGHRVTILEETISNTKADIAAMQEDLLCLQDALEQARNKAKEQQ